MSEQTTTMVVRPLTEIEAEVDRLLAVGYRTSQQIAVLVHGAKRDHFETVPEWLEWCAHRFGYARRTAFQLAKVGSFLGGLGLVHDRALNEGVHDRALVPVHHRALLVCDLHRLESLAELKAQKPDQLEGLLKHWNPAEHTIKEVAAKVKSFLGEETYAIVCADCKQEFESETRKAKRCPDCERAEQQRKEREKARRQAGAFEKHLTALAEKFGRSEELEPHIEEIGPGVAMSASITAAELALTHVDRFRDWTREDCERWLGWHDKITAQLRKLLAEAN